MAILPPPTTRLSDIWLAGLVDIIAEHLHGNEVACNLRLVDKASAKAFSHLATVRLSQRVPHGAFAQYWTQPCVVKALSFHKRRRFVALVAASGDINNLQMAVNLAGCDLTASCTSTEEDPLACAASAGHTYTCMWLHQRGCPLDHRQLVAAAKAGCKDTCAWLLDHGCSWNSYAVYAAAAGGHPELMSWLLARCPVRDVRPDIAELLKAAAEGCDLATLQFLHREYLGRLGPEAQQQLSVLRRYFIMSAAACSPTPDWQAKVAWLEQLGYPRTTEVCGLVTKCPDAAYRLSWLWERGYPVNSRVVWAAAGEGNVAALKFLLDSGVEREMVGAAEEAAKGGHLEALKLLYCRGWLAKPVEVLRVALEGGHLAVVAWLVEVCGVRTLERVANTRGVWKSVASSGCVELLNWLHACGCYAGEDVFSVAAGNASEKMLEWLVAQGYRFPDDGSPYFWAAQAGDLATLSCLYKLGCPWGPVMAGCEVEKLPARVQAWAGELGLPYGKKLHRVKERDGFWFGLAEQEAAVNGEGRAVVGSYY